MSIFAGAMLINASPKPLKPITGFLVGSNCWYLRRKALKGCLPFVKERLDATAQFKADPKCGWTPPVRPFLMSAMSHVNTLIPMSERRPPVAHRRMLCCCGQRRCWSAGAKTSGPSSIVGKRHLVAFNKFHRTERDPRSFQFRSVAGICRCSSG